MTALTWALPELTLISDSQSRPSCVHMDHFGLPVTFSSVPVQ
eukprot:COSAG01_NODE_60442_length_294_cov_8.312821_1_plen_41_part_01